MVWYNIKNGLPRSEAPHNDRQKENTGGSTIEEEIDAANRESGLHIRVLWDKPQVFAGKIKGAENGGKITSPQGACGLLR